VEYCEDRQPPFCGDLFLCWSFFLVGCSMAYVTGAMMLRMRRAIFPLSKTHQRARRIDPAQLGSLAATGSPLGPGIAFRPPRRVRCGWASALWGGRVNVHSPIQCRPARRSPHSRPRSKALEDLAGIGSLPSWSHWRLAGCAQGIADNRSICALCAGEQREHARQCRRGGGGGGM